MAMVVTYLLLERVDWVWTEIEKNGWLVGFPAFQLFFSYLIIQASLYFQANVGFQLKKDTNHL